MSNHSVSQDKTRKFVMLVANQKSPYLLFEIHVHVLTFQTVVWYLVYSTVQK